MPAINNRKCDRVESIVLTSYDCFNDDDEPFYHGMGRTLNVSKEGAYLETHAPIELHDKFKPYTDV